MKRIYWKTKNNIMYLLFLNKKIHEKNNHKHKIIINHIKKNTILNVKLFAIYCWKKKTQLFEIKIVKQIE